MHLLTEVEKNRKNQKITVSNFDARLTLEKPVKTNWYILTGGPGSGKTTTINLISKRGHKTAIEHARHYIDTQRQSGRTVKEIRKNQEEFQLGVLEMQIEQEAGLDPNEIVFLDRALPDALAYYYFLGLPVNVKLIEALKLYRYKKVFILECLPLVQDYARLEDEKAQKKIHELLVKVYTELNVPVVNVPVMSPERRVDFILKHL
jgi:predicted ATPase